MGEQQEPKKSGADFIETRKWHRFANRTLYGGAAFSFTAAVVEYEMYPGDRIAHSFMAGVIGFALLGAARFTSHVHHKEEDKIIHEQLIERDEE